MSILKELEERSGSKCELCGASVKLNVYEVPPVSTGGIDGSLLACNTCIEQIENPDNTDANHWRCLKDSMWSEHTAVQVVAWRMLSRLKTEGWPQDLLEMLYLDEEPWFGQKRPAKELMIAKKLSIEIVMVSF